MEEQSENPLKLAQAKGLSNCEGVKSFCHSVFAAIEPGSYATMGKSVLLADEITTANGTDQVLWQTGPWQSMKGRGKKKTCG